MKQTTKKLKLIIDGFQKYDIPSKAQIILQKRLLEFNLSEITNQFIEMSDMDWFVNSDRFIKILKLEPSLTPSEIVEIIRLTDLDF